MKLYMIHNLVFIPTMNKCGDSNSSELNTIYKTASISGILIGDTYTEQQILNKYKDDKNFMICKDFHDMCKQWGNKD